MLTAILNFYKGAGAFQEAVSLHRFEGLSAVVSRDVHDAFAGLQEGVNMAENSGFVAGAGEDIDLIHRGYFCRISLRITAGQCDNGIRVLTMEAMDDLTGLFVTCGGDGTGIDHIDVGILVSFHDIITIGSELLDHDLGFILIDFAAQGVKSSAHKGFLSEK